MGGKASRGYDLEQRSLTQQESSTSIQAHSHIQLAQDQSFEHLDTRSFLKKKN